MSQLWQPCPCSCSIVIEQLKASRLSRLQRMLNLFRRSWSQDLLLGHCNSAEAVTPCTWYCHVLPKLPKLLCALLIGQLGCTVRCIVVVHSVHSPQIRSVNCILKTPMRRNFVDTNLLSTQGTHRSLNPRPKVCMWHIGRNLPTSLKDQSEFVNNIQAIQPQPNAVTMASSTMQSKAQSVQFGKKRCLVNARQHRRT